MCFSPAASFIAGGALTAVGVYTLTQNRQDVQTPFAAIPLLFGLQQVIEGFVWISFGQPFPHVVATTAYVFFSHVLWPLYLPFAVWAMEPDARRKTWLAACVFIGCVIGAVLFGSILEGPVTSAIVGRCIAYTVPLPNVPFGLWGYVAATVGSCVLSSLKYVRVFGIALLGALAISEWSYANAFYSVWCFFAAMLSLIVLIQLRERKHRA